MTLAQWIVLTAVISSGVWILIFLVVLIRVRYYRRPRKCLRCWSCGRYVDERGNDFHPIPQALAEPGLCLHCLHNKEPERIQTNNGALFGFPLDL